MCENLLVSLIDKGAIKQSTHISARIARKDFSGSRMDVVRDFSLRAIVKQGEDIIFAATLVDGDVKTIYKLPLHVISKIDGMDLTSIARIYDLRPDGTPRVLKIDPITGQPLKRGRKPNWVKKEMLKRQEEADCFDEDDDDDEFDDEEFEMELAN